MSLSIHSVKNISVPLRILIRSTGYVTQQLSAKLKLSII